MYQIAKSDDTTYVMHERCHHAACVTCGERHADDVPCKETELKKYWERLGQQVKTLLGR